MDSEFDLFTVAKVDPVFDGISEKDREKLINIGRERLDTGKEATGGLHLFNLDDPEVEKKRLESLKRYQQKLHKERLQRQADIIRLLKAGYTVEECCWQVNISTETYRKWRSLSKDFQKETAEAQREGARLTQAIDRSNAHTMPFHILRKRCFGRDTYGFQQKMVDIIEDAPTGEITMILLPPGVGKTMTLEDWLTLELAKDQKKRIMYISETDDLGERTLEVLKQRFENESGDFDTLTHLFGKLYDPDNTRAWRAKEIRMPGADVQKRDYSMRTRGMGSQIYSIRADIIVLDDVQTDTSLNRTETFLKRIRKTILTRREGAIEGKVIYIGTRLDLGDLPGRMIEEGMIKPENLYVMPLINTEGKSNFEEVIPTKSLPTLVSQMGGDFQSVYQQNPAGGKDNTFSLVVDNIKDKSYTVKDWYTCHGEQELCGRIITIDPALTGGNAIMAMGWTMTDLFVYDLDIEFNTNRMSYAENMLEEFILSYMADMLVIEDKAYQKALLTSERIEDMCSKYGVKIVPHTTGGDKHDSVFGVAKMETPMQFGKIHVPWGDDYSASRMRPLVSQLQSWRPDVPTKALVQDAVMALWFGQTWVFKERARRAARQRAEDTIAESARRHGTTHRPSGLPFSKTRYRGR